MYDYFFEWLSSHGISSGLIIIAVIVFLLAHRAYRSRIRGKIFHIESSENGPVIQTDLGSFYFLKDTKTCTLQYKNEKKHDFAFSEIKNILIKKANKEAQLDEFLFEDYSFGIDDRILSSSGKYIDVCKTYQVLLNMNTSQQYPILICSQYQVRDFLV